MRKHINSPIEWLFQHISILNISWHSACPRLYDKLIQISGVRMICSGSDP